MQNLIGADPLARGVFVGTVVLMVARELRQAVRRRGEATAHDRGSLLVVRVAAPASYVLAALVVTHVPQSNVEHGRVPLFIVAMVIAWSGLAIRWWSFHALGRYFTITVMTSPDQPVVTTGPYRYVRHPSYTGLLLMLFGIVLALGNWLAAIVGLVGPVVALLYRIKVEEAALTAELGDAYTTFAQSRKRLVPHLW